MSEAIRRYSLSDFPPPVSETQLSKPVGDVIAEGGRNTAMFSIAGTLRRRNLGEAEIRGALEGINASGKVQPPLEGEELDRIAEKV